MSDLSQELYRCSTDKLATHATIYQSSQNHVTHTSLQ